MQGSSLFLEGEGSSKDSVIRNTALAVTDIKGRELLPFQLGNSKVLVLFFVTHDCPISNAYSPELARLRKEYAGKGFKLMLVHVDPDVTNVEIQKHVEDYGLSDYTVVSDRAHVLVQEVGATITPEVAVILPDGILVYRGRIDNMYPALGQRRRVITQKELRDALDSINDNKIVQVTRTEAVGCFVPHL
jgi:thiol-disulfide isomerase/thioredoxin